MISIPFTIGSALNWRLSYFYEYEWAFLYFGDIILVLFLGLGIFMSIKFRKIHESDVIEVIKKPVVYSLFIFLFFAFFSLTFSFLFSVSVYNFIRLAITVFFILLLAVLIKRKWINLKLILAVIGFSAVFQAVIGFVQFIKQSGLGLNLLGEQLLAAGYMGNVADHLGLAVVGIQKQIYIRAYGTFPHPNVLAGFLVIGLFCLYYFYFESEKNRINYIHNSKNNFFVYIKTISFWKRIVIIIGIFLILVGLIFTFSRTALFIALILTILLSLILLLRFRNERSLILRWLSVVTIIFTIVFSFFHWTIFSRPALNKDEAAVYERVIYNKIALDIIKQPKNFFVGVGLGDQVVYSLDQRLYQVHGLNQYLQWQPIHNIYLLTFSEIGVFGFLALIIFLVFLIYFCLKKLRGIKNLCATESGLFILMMLISLILFGFFDHFMWTHQPGKLMFWLVVGSLLGFILSQKETLSKT